MSFEDAMREVEEARAFPAPEHLHARRLAWILDRSGLGRSARALPWALVAGSCGKASTARLLAFIARRLLDRACVDAPVVLGTKPPLSETLDGQRERYQRFDRDAPSPRWIDRDEFARHAAALAPFVAAVEREAPELGPVAPYDLRYAILLRYAVELGAAFAVFEANIGLRDDPTSALPPPAIQLLTPIDTDHAQLLRAPAPLPASLADLGARAGPVWHKAGGLRADVPAVVGAQDSPVARAIATLAVERGVSSIMWRGVDFDVLRSACSLGGSEATLRAGEERLDVHVRAVGAFQVDNAAHAAAAAQELARDGVLPGGVSAWREAARDGLRDAAMPGRMEVLSSRPLTLLQVGASAVKMRGFVDAMSGLVGAERVVACVSFLARIYEAREPVSILARAPWLSALFATACETAGDAADLDGEEVVAVAKRARPELTAIARRDPDAALNEARAFADATGAALVIVGNGLGARDLSMLRGERAST